MTPPKQKRPPNPYETAFEADKRTRETARELLVVQRGFERLVGLAKPTDPAERAEPRADKYFLEPGTVFFGGSEYHVMSITHERMPIQPQEVRYISLLDDQTPARAGESGFALFFRADLLDANTEKFGPQSCVMWLVMTDREGRDWIQPIQTTQPEEIVDLPLQSPPTEEITEQAC